MRDGLIHEAGRADSSGGRRAIRLELSVDVGTAIGVKVAADHLVAVEVRIDGTVVRSVSEPFVADARDAVAVLATHVERFIANGRERQVLGVGVGVPGTVADPEAGVVDSTQLGWLGVPLGRELRSALGLPVLVDNNVNAVALTQMLYGSAQGLDDVLVVTIGTGVGAGLVLDGSIRRGYAGAAGEIGHVPVSAGERDCHCGNRGCLETEIGEAALLARAVEAERSGRGRLDCRAEAARRQWRREGRRNLCRRWSHVRNDARRRGQHRRPWRGHSARRGRVGVAPLAARLRRRVPWRAQPVHALGRVAHRGVER